MLNVLYGRFNLNTMRGRILFPIQALYAFYTLPFLLIALLLYLRSLGAASVSSDEEFGVLKRIGFHFAAIVISFALWGIALSIINDKFGVSVLF